MLTRCISAIVVLAASAAVVFCATAQKAPPADSPVRLPAPSLKGQVSVEDAIARRRSIRSFTPEPLTQEQISQLLWAAQGITDAKRSHRAAPSAGATYPLEVYAVTAEGVFKYMPAEHALRKTKDGDVRASLCTACLGQKFVEAAPLSIVIAAVYERTEQAYGQRAQRYVDIEVGCASENVFLQAVSLDLGSVAVGAFRDAGVSRLVGLPAEEKPVLVVPIGHPSE